MKKIIRVDPIDSQKVTDLRIHLFLGLACNYDCSYCDSHDINVKPTLKPIKDITEGIDFIFKTYNSPKKTEVHLIGGEPILYKGIFNVINALPNFKFCISTNLSAGKKFIEKHILPLGKQIRLHASYHPEFADPYEFIDKVNLLKEGGILTGVSALMLKEEKYWNKSLIVEKAFPGAMTRVALKTSGTNFIFNSLMEYSEEQMKAFTTKENGKRLKYYFDDGTDELIYLKTARKHPELLNFFGMKCHIGKNLVIVKENGDLYPSNCLLNCKKASIGNMYDKKLKIPSNPIICPFTLCFCSQDVEILKEI